MLFSSAKKIRLGYVMAFLLLIFSYFLIFYSTSRLRKSTQWVSHTYIVIAKLESVKTSIAEAESSLRGYVITQDERFLTPYMKSIETFPSYYKEIRKLISDNQTQQLRLDTLDRLFKKRLGLFAFGLKNFRDSGYITRNMIEKWQDSRLTTDSIRLYVSLMKEKEEELLEKRRSSLSGLSDRIQELTILSLIAAVLAVGYSLLLYRHERRAKNEFDKKASQYRNELEESIRKLKNINEELKELKSIEKFAATGRVARTIAHEVRNPLTNITLASEQLQELNTENNNESSTLLDMINRNAVRINQLVSELLNATRSVQLDIQKVNIIQLLDETLAMARDRIELNHIKVEKNYTDDCLIGVDTEKIKFAFLNIIVNAIEAMEKNNGVLQVSVKKEGQKCVVEISDNGKGMDEETLQRIFEAYFTDKQKGNGLGLTNTQNIILSHEGSIKVKSQAGKGSVFTIILDLASPI